MQLAALLEFVQKRLGDSLRAVEWYRGDNAELIYLREDIDLEVAQRRGERLHNEINLAVDLPDEATLDDVGKRLACFDVREEAVIVNIPEAEDYGVIVALEPDATNAVNGFIQEYRERLSDGNSPGADQLGQSAESMSHRLALD